MNNERVAKELVKLAKALIASDGLAMISDLSDWKAYFVESSSDCLDNVDKSAYESAMKHNDTITMGKTVVTPEEYFSSKDESNYRKYGIGKKFNI